MTTAITDDSEESLQIKPGAELAAARIEKGYSTEFIARRLHLRVLVIEQLEADDYEKMPEPVFIKGYLRAYAKLLEISPEPLLKAFNHNYAVDVKAEKALWQSSRREVNHSEHAIRWVTVIFAFGVLVAIAMWWQKNKESENLLAHSEQVSSISESEIRLTDLSKMRSLLSSVHTNNPPGETLSD